jgi:hypothetical protein
VLFLAGSADHLHISNLHMAMLGITFLHVSIGGRILRVFLKVMRRSAESPTQTGATEHCTFANTGRANSTGTVIEGIDEIKRAQELDPVSTQELGGLGHAYFLMHRYDESISYVQKALDLYP